MHTTAELLDMLMARYTCRSDYALAKLLGVTTMTVTRWRMGGTFSDHNALKIADMLKMPRAYIIACMGGQRAEPNTEESGVWRQIAGHFRETVSLWLIVFALGFGSFFYNSSEAHSLFADANNIHYAKCRRRASVKGSTHRTLSL